VEIMEGLNWPTLRYRRQLAKLIMMYRITYHLIEIPSITYLIPSRSGTRGHNIRYLQPSTRVLAYQIKNKQKYQFQNPFWFSSFKLPFVLSRIHVLLMLFVFLFLLSSFNKCIPLFRVLSHWKLYTCHFCCRYLSSNYRLQYVPVAVTSQEKLHAIVNLYLDSNVITFIQTETFTNLSTLRSL
jgi:hypothetical protein